MELTSGTRLGPYEIVSRIGAGGMGEVWKARDTRLDRSVAIKVLPNELAANAQLRLRFEREAKTISQLNHPHICTLFDVGDDYLVMELIEGESLADRVAKGPLPIEDVVRYGVQIAEALDRAHRAGVVHRDLKPGNVMITKSGAKLLDFGLAKSAVVDVGANDVTRQKSLTQEGTILGTFQYMAPEQLEGTEADARTDIFAFGALLYEMITGRRAFDGKTRTSLIAAIVSGTPAPVSQVRPLTPPALDHIVARCLAKDPDERWQSARDLAEELRWIGQAGSQAGVAVPVTTRRRSRERVAWALVTVLALAVAALTAWLARERMSRERASVVRVKVGEAPAIPMQVSGSPVAISRDGTRIAMLDGSGDAPRMAIRRTDSLEIRPLVGTEWPRDATFSPDGQWLAFFSGSDLKKVPVSGGPAQVIAPSSGQDPSWEADGTILFQSREGLWRVAASGGTPQLILPLDVAKGHLDYREPSLLPGGRAMLFSIVDSRGSWLDQNIAVYDFDKRNLRVIRPGTNATYLPTGHLLYAAAANLYVVSFDPKSYAAGSDPVRVLDGVATSNTTGVAAYDVAANGSLVYAGGDVSSPVNRLVLVDRSGTSTSLALPSRGYEHPRFSPDGKRLLVALRGPTTDVWVHDSDRGTFSRLTFEAVENETPIWTPDGRSVIFSASRRDVARVHFLKAADGTGAEHELFRAPTHQHAGSVSPDGKTFVLSEYATATSADLWIAATTPGSKPRVLLRTPFNERAPRFSPDGKWIAYSSDESGRYEVYVIGSSGGGKWQISTSGGAAPVWSRDGRELFYQHEKQLMVVDVVSGSSFSASVPRQLFTGEYVSLQRGDANYDVSPDGKRFVMIQRDAEARNPPMVLVVNWLEEVKRLTTASR